MKLDSFLAGWVGTGWWWVQRPNSHYFKICLIWNYNNREGEPWLRGATARRTTAQPTNQLFLTFCVLDFKMNR